MRTVRLTVGQAIVRFMAAQDVERDGHRQRFIAGVWGIFGHGNVAGLGQALEEYGDACGLPYYRPQNEQAQVHIAPRLRAAPRIGSDVRLHLVGRPRRDEHDHRRGGRDRQPDPRAAASRATSSRTGRRSRPPAGGAPDRSRTSARTTRSGRSLATTTGSPGPSSCSRRCRPRSAC